MSIYRFFLCGFVVLAFAVSSAQAEDDKNVTSQKETPLSILNKATDEIMKGLDENQLKQFAAIEGAHGTIRAIEDVQMSLTRAVKSCSDAHPDMKEGLSAEFEGWKDAIRPEMRRANKKLDKMILLQGFAQPSQVRAYLKKFDAAVVDRNQKIKPVAISSSEDCEKFQGSMSKTKANLTKLLVDTLGLDTPLEIKK